MRLTNGLKLGNRTNACGQNNIDENAIRKNGINKPKGTARNSTKKQDPSIKKKIKFLRGTYTLERVRKLFWG